MPEAQTKVKILGWRYENIRGLETMDVNLESQDHTPYPITLIMMPNGQGKTTTMELLLAAFTGGAQHWSRGQVLELRPPGSTAKSGEFQLRLLIDGQRFIVTLELDYQTGSASYATTRIDISGGKEPGHNLPSSLKHVFKDQFVKRFIFDGELVKDILNGSKDEAEKTIRYLHNLDRLEELAVAIDHVKDDMQRERETASRTDRGLTRLRNQRDEAFGRMRQLQTHLAQLESQFNEATTQLEQRETFLQHRLAQSEQLQRRYEESQRQLETVRRDLVLKGQAAIASFREPTMANRLIFSRLNQLSSRLQRLKLPESTSRQFFTELAEEEFCVCGRPIRSTERDAILSRAESYLGHDEYGVVNAIKQEIRNSTYDDSLTDTINNLTEFLTEESRHLSELRRIELEQENSGDDDVRQAAEERDDLRAKLTSLDEKIPSFQLALKTAKDNYESLQRKFNEATQTVEFIRKADKLKDIARQTSAAALKNLKATIIENTNRRIADVIHLEKISVEAIDGHLKLAGKGGASQGQSLAIAYSFLGSLFANSAFGLPFVVDSPAGPLDLEVRHEVATMLPGLFDQLILLVMSGEREAFADPFYQLAGVQFLTVVKDSSGPHCVAEIETFKKFQGGKEDI